MDNMKKAVVQELWERGSTSPTNPQGAHAVRGLSIASPSSSTDLGQAIGESARHRARRRSRAVGEDYPSIVNELATSLRRMLLLYEDRALRRTCDRWEHEARDVLAKLPPPAPTNVVFGKEMNADKRGELGHSLAPSIASGSLSPGTGAPHS